MKKLVILAIAIIFFSTIFFGFKFSQYVESKSLRNTNIYRKATYLVSYNLNPADSLSTAEHTRNNLLYQGLFRVNGNLEIIADIAKTWEFNPIKAVYKFKIFPNLKFSDGSRLTANEIVDSLEYLVFKSKNSNQFRAIRKVVATSQEDIEIFVRDAKVSLIPILAAPQAKIWRTENANGKLLGSGPFKLAHDNFDKLRMSLVRNIYFVASTTTGIERMELIQLTESEARRGLISGEIDDTIDIPFTDKLDLEKYYELKSKAAITWLIAFNVKSSPLRSLKLRQCLIDSFHSDEFVHNYLNSHEVASGYLPSSLPGSDIEIVKHSKVCRSIGKFKLHVEVPNEIQDSREICKYIVEKWRMIGGNVFCKPTSFENILNNIQNKKYEASLLAMSMDMPDVDYFLNSFESGASFSLSNFSSPIIDKLLKSSRQESNKELRNPIYRQINQIIYDNALTLNISYPQHLSYVSKCISNISVSIAGPAFTDYSKVKLDSKCQR